MAAKPKRQAGPTSASAPAGTRLPSMKDKKRKTKKTSRGK